MFPQYVKLADENQKKNSLADYTRKEIDINEPIDDIEKTLWIYLRKLLKDKKVDDLKKPAKVVQGAKVVETGKKGTSASNVLVVVDDGKNDEQTVTPPYLQPIFETSNGFQTKAFILTTMITGRWVSDDVVTCWAMLMNYEERVVTNNAPKRLFLHAQTFMDDMIRASGNSNTATMCKKLKKNIKYVLEEREDLMDFNHFDLVVVPVIEDKHYYVIVFDMIGPGIEVIDNHDCEFICPDVGCTYAEKGTSAKIKYLFCKYMEEMKHPMARFMHRCVVSKKKIEWFTVDNETDCAVFAMRHMEMHKGCGHTFECGFNLVKDVQDTQLTNLRMRYTTKIMSSPANVIGADVFRMAEEAVANLNKTVEDGKEPNEVEEDNALLSYVDEECEEVERTLRDITMTKSRNVDRMEAKSKGKCVSCAE